MWLLGGCGNAPENLKFRPPGLSVETENYKVVNAVLATCTVSDYSQWLPRPHPPLDAAAPTIYDIVYVMVTT